MGRAKASQFSREFSITFANVVTVPSNAKNDWIAKNGCYSLFKLLTVVAPRACRGFGGDRHGISEAELNKALESHGFTRVRVRLRSIVASAGTLLFDARRWLNPNCESDLHLLIRAFGALRARFPHILACDETSFLRAVARHRDEWVLRTRGGGRAAAEALCRSTGGGAAPYSAVICAPSRAGADSPSTSSRRSSESTELASEFPSEFSSDPSDADVASPAVTAGRPAGAFQRPRPFRCVEAGRHGAFIDAFGGFVGGFAGPGLPRIGAGLASVSERDSDSDCGGDGCAVGGPAHHIGGAPLETSAVTDGSSPGRRRRRRRRAGCVTESPGGAGPLPVPGGEGLALPPDSDDLPAGAGTAAAAVEIADYLRQRFFAACLASRLRPPPSPPPPPPPPPPPLGHQWHSAWQAPAWSGGGGGGDGGGGGGAVAWEGPPAGWTWGDMQGSKAVAWP